MHISNTPECRNELRRLISAWKSNKPEWLGVPPEHQFLYWMRDFECHVVDWSIFYVLNDLHRPGPPRCPIGNVTLMCTYQMERRQAYQTLASQMLCEPEQPERANATKNQRIVAAQWERYRAAARESAYRTHGQRTKQRIVAALNALDSLTADELAKAARCVPRAYVFNRALDDLLAAGIVRLDGPDADHYMLTDKSEPEPDARVN